jgi:hypothetical protein
MSEPRKVPRAAKRAPDEQLAADQLAEQLKQANIGFLNDFPEFFSFRPLLQADRDLEDAAGKAIGAIGRLVIDYVREPENQAYMVGCMLTAPLTHKMRAIPGILVTMCGGYAARQAYRATRDLRDLAEAATADRNADAPAEG